MTPDKRSSLYLRMAHLGAIGVFLEIAAVSFDLSDFVKGIGVGMMLIPLIVLLLRGLRDEYIESLWHAGTSWAFVALVLSFILMPFFWGVYEGFQEARTGQTYNHPVPGDLAGYVSLAAFFIGFHVKWLRSTL